MFGQVLDKLTSWLSTSFLLANFFPWLLFAVANLATVYAAFPDWRPLIDRYVSGEPSEKAVVIVCFLGLIAIAAYLSAPLIQVLTELLEGQHLPPLLSRSLTIAHADRLSDLERYKDDLFRERQQLRRLNNSAPGTLRAARDDGNKNQRNLFPDKIKTVVRTVRRIQQKRRHNQLIRFSEISALVTSLKDALENNCAEATLLKPPYSSDDPQRSASLDEAFIVGNQLLEYALGIVSQHHAFAYLDRLRLFGLAEVAPTRLGNDAAALRSYCESRYGLEFDFFWPRLQLVLQKDDKRSAAIVNAKIRLDFVVLLFWLTTIFTGSWLLVLGLWGRSLLVLLIVAGIGPLLIAAWLGIVHASYAAFTETVSSIVDLNRFDLLTALHRGLPVSTQAEKQAWEQAAALLMFNEARDTPFKHT